jgi:hypothetical protein
MAKNKTVATDQNVYEFLETFVDSEQKKKDSLKLIELFKEVTGADPIMWGPSIIGFGTYHYTYASGHQGDAPVLGFSPRKAAITLYVHSNTERTKDLLDQLGTYKISKACIYIKKLSDIDCSILKEICHESISYLSTHFECSCHGS